MPLKKLLKIFIITMALLSGWLYLTRYKDSAFGCNIKITPSILEFSNLNMKRALRVLKFAAPEEYELVCRDVKVIVPAVGCGGFGGGCFYPDSGQSGKIYVSTSQSDLLWTAGVIVHEACHARQFATGSPLEESECYKADDAAIRKIVEF